MTANIENAILKLVERTPLTAHQILTELHKTMPVDRQTVYSTITQLVQYQQLKCTEVNGFIAYCQRRIFDAYDFDRPLRVEIAGANTRHLEGNFKLDGTIVTNRKVCKKCNGGLWAKGQPHGRSCRECYNTQKRGKKYYKKKKVAPAKEATRTDQR